MIMIVFVLIVTVILSINGLFYYFLDKGWKRVYTAFDNKQFYRVTAKLQSNGIKYRTKLISNLRGTDPFRDSSGTIEIYVLAKDETKAFQAIQS